MTLFKIEIWETAQRSRYIVIEASDPEDALKNMWTRKAVSDDQDAWEWADSEWSGNAPEEVN